MGKPHKHADLIKAWADGAEIEARGDGYGGWNVVNNPFWFDYMEYRIKPEPKPDVVKLFKASIDLKYGDAISHAVSDEWLHCSNLKLTFDGETGKLKSAEVL